MAARGDRTDGGLQGHGLEPAVAVHWNLSIPALYTHALRRDEGVLADGGPLVVDTGAHTGRSPNDKFVVAEPGSEARIWWGAVNQRLGEEPFEALRADVAAYLGGRELYVVDAFAGADPAHRIAARIVTPVAYHALFARTMFITPADEELVAFVPDALVLHAPAFEADPARHGTQVRHVHRAASVPAGGADRGHVLRRRDQEVDLHPDERPPAARRSLPDALLGQRGRCRRRRPLLRALGHRQDDALRRLPGDG